MIQYYTPRWPALAKIGLFGIAALIEEARLPFSPAADTWLMLLWLAVVYGAVALWITGNRVALEQGPPALDCVGRPIMDYSAPQFSAILDTRSMPREQAAPPLNQSEAY
jgi:hypothetical protein